MVTSRRTVGCIDPDKLILITGHQDGKIVQWEDLVPVKVLSRSTSAIVDLAIIKNFVAVASAEGVIELFTLSFQQKLRRLDIRSFAYKLSSNSIKNLVVTHNSLYFNTYGGDFIKLKLIVTQSEDSKMTVTFRVGLAHNRTSEERTW
jgi:hypothetical protein